MALFDRIVQVMTRVLLYTLARLLQSARHVGLTVLSRGTLTLERFKFPPLRNHFGTILRSDDTWMTIVILAATECVESEM